MCGDYAACECECVLSVERDCVMNAKPKHVKTLNVNVNVIMSVQVNVFDCGCDCDCVVGAKFQCESECKRESD